MGKTDRNQQALNWLEKEKKKDNLEIKSVKDKLITEIKTLNKEDLFKKDEEPEKKESVWSKIQKMIWGS